jgi:hypothetical protein
MHKLLLFDLAQEFGREGVPEITVFPDTPRRIRYQGSGRLVGEMTQDFGSATLPKLKGAFLVMNPHGVSPRKAESAPAPKGGG